MTTRLLAIALAVASAAPLGSALGQDVQQAEQQAIKSAIQRVAPSVLRIETVGGLERVGQTTIAAGPTTGVAISEDGYLVSSLFNFVQLPSSILVTTPSGKRAPAEIVARDESRMMVLLKVNTDEKFAVPEVAPRSQWRVGQWTIALGRAIDPQQLNVSVGVLSAKERVWGKALQTDAKVSPSNYGGPLIDIQGRVLGVLAPMSPRGDDAMAGSEWYDSGIGFAVAWEDLLARLETLKQGQDLKPGVLGVVLDGADVYADPCKIGGVRPASPAADAGLLVGDEIVEINGEPTIRQAQLKHALGRLYAGDQVHLIVRRDDQRLPLAATLTDELLPYQHPFLGVLPRRDFQEEGVAVRYVFADSPAAKAGIQTADVILGLGGEAVQGIAQLQDLITRFSVDETVPIRWRRGDQEMTADAQLTALPEEVPSDVLPEPTDPPGAAPDNLATGEVEINLLEEANKCHAFIPADYRPDASFGLLVWLHAPQFGDAPALIEQWKDICTQNHLVLLLPIAQDPARWTPTEIDVVEKAIEQLRKEYPVSADRIVIGGEEAGGAMAILTMFSASEVVRGVVAFDAALPRRAAPPDSDPLKRRAFFFMPGFQSKLAEPIADAVKLLRAMKHPVTQVDSGGEEMTRGDRESIGRWVERPRSNLGHAPAPFVGDHLAGFARSGSVPPLHRWAVGGHGRLGLLAHGNAQRRDLAGLAEAAISQGGAALALGPTGHRRRRVGQSSEVAALRLAVSDRLGRALRHGPQATVITPAAASQSEEGP